MEYNRDENYNAVESGLPYRLSPHYRQEPGLVQPTIEKEEDRLANTNRSYYSTTGQMPSVEKASCEMSARFPLTHGATLMISNLHPHTDDQDLVALAVPFGTVRAIKEDYHKRSAFIEFQTVDGAKRMVAYAQNNQIKHKNHLVYVQAAPYESLQVHPDEKAHFDKILSTVNLHAASKTLHVVVERISQPVNIDTIFTLFSMGGEVHKIVVFYSGEKFQALVQMASIEQAISCKYALDYRAIYTDCNFLAVSFSKQPELNITGKNLQSSRDYFNDPAPKQPLITLSEGQFIENRYSMGLLSGGDSAPGNRSRYVDERAHDRTYGRYGNEEAAYDYYSRPPNHRDRYHMGQTPYSPVHRGGRRSSSEYGRFDRDMRGVPAGYQDPYCQDATNEQVAPVNEDLNGPVLIVSNMPEDLTSDEVATFYGNFGNVARVKRMSNKKDTCLVEFCEDHHCNLAIKMTHRVPLGDTPLRVSLSKHKYIRGGKTKNSEDEPVYEVPQSQHRFKGTASRNFKNVHSPSCYLHLSGLPEHFGEEEVKELFREKGFEISDFHPFKDSRMAIVKTDSIKTALSAICALHNTRIEDHKMLLKVSFTKPRSN